MKIRTRANWKWWIGVVVLFGSVLYIILGPHSEARDIQSICGKMGYSKGHRQGDVIYCYGDRST